jgi:HEPN domain-containing protein
MSDPDPGELRALAAEWLRVADVDKETVRVCVDAGRTFYPVAAFHCQQAAEKLMKGFLVLANIDFRKTHNLRELGRTVAGPFPELENLVTPMAEWTTWSFAYRYPMEGPNAAPEPTETSLRDAYSLIDDLSARLRARIG